VSEDRDLLVLEEYQGVKIVDAATFLSIIEQ
jgi:predicted nucleic acid-binding protein